MATTVFVASAARSGSTMLDLMLASHPRAGSCGEIGSWYDPPRGRRLGLQCSCGADPCPQWSFLSCSLERHHFHCAFVANRGVDIVVDSSKRLGWILEADRWCRQAGIETRHVLLWKEPKALAFSHWKRGGDIDKWRPRFRRYYGPYLRSGLEATVVSYENLVSAPAQQLATLSDRLDLPFTADQVDFWQFDHHNLYGSAGIKAQRQLGDSVVALAPYPAPFERAWEASAGVDPKSQALVDQLEALSQGTTELMARPTSAEARLRAIVQSGRLRARGVVARLGGVA